MANNAPGFAQFPLVTPIRPRAGVMYREKDLPGNSQSFGFNLNVTDGSTQMGASRGHPSEASRPAPRPTTSGKAPFILRGTR